MHIIIFVFVEVELEDTRQENMTLRWQNGAISNFEYLMYLNRLVKFINLTLNNTVVFNFTWFKLYLALQRYLFKADRQRSQVTD